MSCLVLSWLLFVLSLIFLGHNKDGSYNSTIINKQLSPAQNTPALQATHPIAVESAMQYSC